MTHDAQYHLIRLTAEAVALSDRDHVREVVQDAHMFGRRGYRFDSTFPEPDTSFALLRQYRNGVSPNPRHLLDRVVD